MPAPGGRSAGSGVLGTIWGTPSTGWASGGGWAGGVGGGPRGGAASARGWGGCPAPAGEPLFLRPAGAPPAARPAATAAPDRRLGGAEDAPDGRSSRRRLELDGLGRLPPPQA